MFARVWYYGAYFIQYWRGPHLFENRQMRLIEVVHWKGYEPARVVARWEL